MALRTFHRSVYLMGGERQDRPPFALPDSVSAEGSANMRFSKLGLMNMVNGYVEQNAAAITTDTGGDATRVVGLSHYKDSSGNIRWVAVVTDDVNEVEVFHSTDDGASFTFLAEIAGALGLEPHMAQFEDSLFICFGGSVAVQKYDGSSVAAAGQTQPTAPSVAAGAAGILNGTFKYKTAEIAADGTVGPYSSGVTVSLVNQKGSLSSIDLGANGARVARTLADGDLTTVYYVVEDVTGATFTDNVPDKRIKDNGIAIDDPGDAPPAGSELSLSHRARHLYLKGDDIHFTPVGKPESVGDKDSLRIGEGRGADNVKAAYSLDQEAIILMEHSIWALSGNGRRTYSLTKLPSHVGTVSKHSSCMVEGGTVFTDQTGNKASVDRTVVAYMTGEDVRIVGAGLDVLISAPIHDVMETMSFQHRAQAWCAFYEPYHWLIVAIPTADKTYTYRAMDTRFGTWHPVDFLPNLACAAIGESATEQHRLMTGLATTGGKIYQAFSGTSADGSNITAKIRTKPLDNGQPGREAFLHAVLPLFEAQGSSVIVTQSVYEGFPDTTVAAFTTDTINLLDADANWISPDDAIIIKTAAGVRTHAKAHVLEWSVSGQTLWGMSGWDWWYQPWMQHALVTP